MPTSLATVAQLGAFTKTTLSDTDPTALLMLSIASGMVRDKLQQQISLVTNEVVVLDPIDTTVLLPDLPVISVSLVETFDGTTWNTLSAADYTVSKRTGVIQAARWSGLTWPSDPGSWRVTYTHGYAVIPDAIVGVTLGVAARAYASPVAVESERIGGYQVKYAMEAEGFSAIEKSALSRYMIARVS